MAAEATIQFVPSGVEGLPSVTQVAVFPDRLELLSKGNWVVIHFLDIARWSRLGWFYHLLARFGWGVRGCPKVGERDWFHPPAGRFFRFYSRPPVTVFLPNESPDLGYEQTLFLRVQMVMVAGGFRTWDLG